MSRIGSTYPDDQREAMGKRVFFDIAYVESLVRKNGLY
jgi:hypothetical protein